MARNVAYLPLIPLLVVLASCGGGGGGTQGGGGAGGGLTRDQAAQRTTSFLRGVSQIGDLFDLTGDQIEQATSSKAVRIVPLSPSGAGERPEGKGATRQPQVQSAGQDSDGDGMPDWVLIDYGTEGATFETFTLKNGFKAEDTGPGIRITYNPSELGGRKFTIVVQGQITETISGSAEMTGTEQGNRKTTQVTLNNLTFSFQGEQTGTFAWNGSATHEEVDADQDGSFDDPGTETYLALSNVTLTINGSSATYSTPENDPVKWVNGPCDYPVDGTLQIQTSLGSATVDFGNPADCGLATVYIGGQMAGVLNLATGQFVSGD